MKKYFIFLLVVSSLIGRASAYTLLVTSNGLPPVWASMPVPFWINQSGSPQIANGSEFGAVQAAFQTWQNVSIADVSFQYKGPTPVSTVGQDGLNVVTFVDGSVPMGLETAAATFSFFNVDATGNFVIQEADIALNPSVSFSTSAETGKYDIQAVVTHEVGHLLGLDHSALLSSVMTPFQRTGLDERTLSYDDMAGVASLYTQNADFSTLGAIAGTITLSGSSIFGAHVVAVDTTGSVKASAISNPDGSYEIDFLPPGAYRVYAEPLDGPITEGNIGGASTLYYTGLNTNFGTTYSGDVSDLSRATAVSVLAGLTSPATQDIHLLPAPSFNVTSPAGYALTLPVGQTASLILGGFNIVSTDSFSTSGSGLTFGAPADIVFGSGTPPTNVQVQLAASSTASLGPKNISVSANGSTSVLSGGIIIVNPEPASIAVAPVSGSIDGGTGVSISGQNFRAGAQVYFGGLAATNVQVVNSTTITAIAPANTAGTANVVVVNTDGTWGVQTSAFTYTGVPPQINSVSPLSGSPSTIVIISGAEFSSRASDMDVRFNGAPANVVSTSRTSATVLVPFGATTGPITITVAGQPVTGPVFTVTPAPVSTNLAFNTAQFIDATAGGTALTFGNNDDAAALTTLPFTFTLFDKTYAAGSTIAISTNGWVSLDAFTSPDYQSGTLPGSTLPPALIAPFLADLFLPGNASVTIRSMGSAPSRQLVIEWLNAGILDTQGNDLGSSITFEAVLYEGSNDIQFIYRSMNGPKSDGSTATIGIQNSARTQAVLTGFNQAVVSSGAVVGYHFLNGTYVPLSAAPPPSDTAYAISNLGGLSVSTDGSGATTAIGFATIKPNAGSTTPSGIAVFSYKPGALLISEAGVPASPPIQGGRFYAEVNGAVDTGVAIANPNSTAATFSFYFTDGTGTDSVTNSMQIPANGHISQFLDDPGINAPTNFQGTFTFSSNVPVAVIALRRSYNANGDSLLSTLPVTDLSAAVANTPSVLPHMADGGGWKTQVILVNPTDSAMAGTILFLNQSGQTLSTSPFSIPRRSSFKQVTPGTASVLQSGSIQITPSQGSNTPTSFAIFSNQPSGVPVSEAAVLATTGSALRMYVEASGVPETAGSIRSGVALANPSASDVNVSLDLTDLTGHSLASASMILHANSQSPQFIDQIFTGLGTSVKGVLRVSTSGVPVSVAALRGRYNEQGQFLMSTTPPVDETVSPANVPSIFAQIANGGGFTTQFILFSGAANQSASGDLQLTYAK